MELYQEKHSQLGLEERKQEGIKEGCEHTLYFQKEESRAPKAIQRSSGLLLSPQAQSVCPWRQVFFHFGEPCGQHAAMLKEWATPQSHVVMPLPQSVQRAEHQPKRIILES